MVTYRDTVEPALTDKSLNCSFSETVHHFVSFGSLLSFAFKSPSNTKYKKQAYWHSYEERIMIKDDRVSPAITHTLTPFSLILFNCLFD